MNPAEKLALITEVLGKAYEETESWNDNHLGTHLAYLCDAIATDWSITLGDCPDTAITLASFRLWFPVGHPVWNFIEIRIGL